MWQKGYHSWLCLKNEKKRKVFRKHSCYHCQRIAHTAQDLPAKEYEKKVLKTNTYIMKQCHIYIKRGWYTYTPWDREKVREKWRLRHWEWQVKFGYPIPTPRCYQKQSQWRAKPGGWRGLLLVQCLWVWVWAVYNYNSCETLQLVLGSVVLLEENSDNNNEWLWL